MNIERTLKVIKSVAVIALLGGAPFGAQGGDYSFQTFQAPDALDTLPFGINNKRVVTGLWYPAEFTPEGALVAEHGFIYTPDGTLTTIDGPSPEMPYTLMYQVNQAGQLAAGLGNLETSLGAVYDSRRDNWTILPAPAASAISSQAVAINDRGQVFGIWADNLFFLNNHGWLYDHGRYTSFDAPGASSDWFGTLPNSANDRGEVVGDYYDSEGGVHGFIRKANGAVENIDVPNTAAGLTRALGINDQGTIVGTYWDAAGFHHGYILSKGSYVVFDFPNTANTILTGINSRGDLVGYGYNDFSEPSFAFVALRRNGK